MGPGGFGGGFRGGYGGGFRARDRGFRGGSGGGDRGFRGGSGGGSSYSGRDRDRDRGYGSPNGGPPGAPSGPRDGHGSRDSRDRRDGRDGRDGSRYDDRYGGSSYRGDRAPRQTGSNAEPLRPRGSASGGDSGGYYGSSSGHRDYDRPREDDYSRKRSYEGSYEDPRKLRRY